MKWFHPLTESTIELCLWELEKSTAHSGGIRPQQGHIRAWTQVWTHVVYYHRYSTGPQVTAAEQEDPCTEQFLGNSCYSRDLCSLCKNFHYKSTPARDFKVVWKNPSVACFSVIMFATLKAWASHLTAKQLISSIIHLSPAEDQNTNTFNIHHTFCFMITTKTDGVSRFTGAQLEHVSGSEGAPWKTVFFCHR